MLPATIPDPQIAGLQATSPTTSNGIGLVVIVVVIVVVVIAAIVFFVRRRQ